MLATHTEWENPEAKKLRRGAFQTGSINPLNTVRCHRHVHVPLWPRRYGTCCRWHNDSHHTPGCEGTPASGNPLQESSCPWRARMIACHRQTRIILQAKQIADKCKQYVSKQDRFTLASVQPLQESFTIEVHHLLNLAGILFYVQSGVRILIQLTMGLQSNPQGWRKSRSWIMNCTMISTSHRHSQQAQSHSNPRNNSGACSARLSNVEQISSVEGFEGVGEVVVIIVHREANVSIAKAMKSCNKRSLSSLHLFKRMREWQDIAIHHLESLPPPYCRNEQ